MQPLVLLSLRLSCFSPTGISGRTEMTLNRMIIVTLLGFLANAFFTQYTVNNPSPDELTTLGTETLTFYPGSKE